MFRTSQPLAFRDTDFVVVQLLIFGQFSYIQGNRAPLQLITEFVEWLKAILLLY